MRKFRGIKLKFEIYNKSIKVLNKLIMNQPIISFLQYDKRKLIVLTHYRLYKNKNN